MKLRKIVSAFMLRFTTTTTTTTTILSNFRYNFYYVSHSHVEILALGRGPLYIRGDCELLLNSWQNAVA